MLTGSACVSTAGGGCPGSQQRDDDRRHDERFASHASKLAAIIAGAVAEVRS